MIDSESHRRAPDRLPTEFNLDTLSPTELTPEMVAAFVSNNSVLTSELPALIQAVHTQPRRSSQLGRWARRPKSIGESDQEFLRKETLLGISRPSALHYGTGGARGSPTGRPTIEGSVSSRDVDEIRKSPNPGTPGDVKLSNCMSST